jgi:hypothetical protein
MPEYGGQAPNSGWSWFGAHSSPESLAAAGFRSDGGGVHQSKTMMLRELEALLAAQGNAAGQIPSALVLDDNVLGKSTGSARRLALGRLRTLHGIGSSLPIWRALGALWALDPAGRRLLALLSAIARDPLLRDTGEVVLPVSPGTPLRWPVIAAHLEARHPGRFSPKMLKSLSQNCASTWTQSCHLEGRVEKVRVRATATPVVAAYAALLGETAGFGGPALLDSPWMRVLDRPREERTSLLRRAEGMGLARLRVAGDVIEIGVGQPMARTLGIPGLGELR